MIATDAAPPKPAYERKKLNPLQCALTGATVAAALSILGSMAMIAMRGDMMDGAHMYGSAASAGAMGVAMLLFGVIGAGLVGALIGVLVALAYNGFAFVARP